MGSMPALANRVILFWEADGVRRAYAESVMACKYATATVHGLCLRRAVPWAVLPSGCAGGGLAGACSQWEIYDAYMADQAAQVAMEAETRLQAAARREKPWEGTDPDAPQAVAADDSSSDDEDVRRRPGPPPLLLPQPLHFTFPSASRLRHLLQRWRPQQQRGRPRRWAASVKRAAKGGSTVQ